MRTSLKAAMAGTVATMAIGGAVIGSPSGAQADDERKTMTGTWRVTVQPYTGPSTTPFESTVAYSAHGSVVETTSRGPMSAGLGTWERVGKRQFETTIEKYRFDSTGAFVGRTVITEVQELTADGSGYEGRATTQLFDRHGVAGPTFQSTVAATRL